MILNPRRKRKSPAKKKRKMSAKQLKFFGPRKKAKKKAKSRVIIVTSNPKGKNVATKKKRRTRRRKAKVFTHNPKTKRRRMRRNPRSIEAGFFKNTIIPSAIGAAGAIGTDMLISYLPIPPQLKTGWMLPVLKIGGALLVGMAVGAVSNREAGEEAAAGAVIVTLYGLAKGYTQGHSPMQRYVPMNRYVPMQGWGNMPLNRPQGRPGLGYMSPARVGPPTVNRATMRFLANQG